MSKTGTRATRLRDGSADRRQRQREETRAAILRAASTLFLEHGYENFSLREVAERIGYSPTTIYLYFANKDDLLYWVAMDGFETFTETLKAAYDSSDEPLLRLARLGRNYYDFGLSHPLHYRLMFMQRTDMRFATPPKGHESPNSAFGVLFETVQALMEGGIFRRGEVRTVANYIWSGVHGIVSLAINEPQIDEAEAEAMLELYMKGLIVALQP